MDPLSISASIITVLQLTGTVLQYVINVDDASNERQRLYSELCGTNDMLCNLYSRATQMQSNDPYTATLQSLCMAGGLFEQRKATLERLAKILKPAKGMSKVTAVISWPFKSKEVKDLLNVLERQKNLISLALQKDHL